VRNGFMSAWQMGLLTVGTEAADLLPRLVQAAGSASERMDLSQI